jgi:hypothetical protein
LEILRRFLWNVLKIETEHLHNCEKFRFFYFFFNLRICNDIPLFLKPKSVDCLEIKSVITLESILIKKKYEDLSYIEY